MLDISITEVRIGFGDEFCRLVVGKRVLIRLVKYQDPDRYTQFFDSVLCESLHEKIHCTTSVKATGGEV